MALAELREVVCELRSSNSLASAVFWADKAVSLSEGDPEDVLALCECLFGLGEPLRAIGLLERIDLSPPAFLDAATRITKLKLFVLEVRCFAANQQWEECLQLLESLGEREKALIPSGSPSPDRPVDPVSRSFSQLWLWKGRAFESVANRKQAAICYRRALQLDRFCYEAFELLVDHNLLVVDPDHLPTTARAQGLPSSNSLLLLKDELSHLNESLDLAFDPIFPTTSTPLSSSPSITAAAATTSTAASSSAATATVSPAVASDALETTTNEDTNEEAETAIKAHNLLSSLTVTAQCPWLRTLYACKIWQYGSFLRDQDGLSDETIFAPLPGAFRSNSLVLAAQAERYFYTDQFQAAYDQSKQVIESDARNNLPALAVYISCLVELERTNELYYCAHKLVQASPKLAISWYAIGCYYHLVGRYMNARRYFGKAVDVDASFGPTWIGFGHSFSNQSEPDQALAAYYTASRIIPGSHLPLLYIAMEYRRLANPPLAKTFLAKSCRLCPTDPLLWSEFGVDSYLENDFTTAIRHFEHCLDLLAAQKQRPSIPAAWEPVLFNLGHCHRKLGHLAEARELYMQCLCLQQKASTLTALGFVERLQGNIDAAVEHYHTSLSITPGDTMTTELLLEALRPGNV